MLKKLRLRLSLIYVITTGIVLAVATSLLFGISTNQMNTQRELMFQNDLNSLIYKLQSSRIIDNLWLAQLESTNTLLIHIEDNGHPIFFPGAWTPKTDRAVLVQQAKEIAQENYFFDVSQEPVPGVHGGNFSFTLEGDDGDQYQATLVTLASRTDWQGLVLLRDLSADRQQDLILRLAAFGIIVMALLLLFLFSLWFSKRAIAPVEESSERQSAFVAAASHELRSPLAVIKSSVSAIRLAHQEKDSSSKVEVIEKYALTADRECIRMSQLIEDLLFLASADAHHWTIKTECIPMDTLLIEIYEAYQPLTAEKQQKLLLSFPEDPLPYLSGDKQRLFQALAAIMGNALFYTPTGGTIEISAHNEKNLLRISIADNGPGIAEKDKKHIFERFYRADAAHTMKGHYGLGLSVAKEIIELHGGKLIVADTPGGGATFHFLLNH